VETVERFGKMCPAAGEAPACRQFLHQENSILDPTDTNLSWDYAYQHRLELDDRLKRGGIRIAAYLNWVFEEPLNQGASPANSSRKPAKQK